MCVIIMRPAEKRIDKDLLRRCYDNNPDGWGLMYPEGSTTKIATAKSMDGFDTFMNEYEQLGDIPIGIHFRWKTHGEKNIENCHPFMVLLEGQHGIDLAMMHNGVLSIDRPIKEMSDTWHMSAQFLRPMLEKSPDLIDMPQFQELISHRIGNSNKLLFMKPTGEPIIINRNAGTERDGVWFSNTYSFTQNYRSKSVGYNGGYSGGYGGGMYSGPSCDLGGSYNGNRWAGSNNSHPTSAVEDKELALESAGASSASATSGSGTGGVVSLTPENSTSTAGGVTTVIGGNQKANALAIESGTPRGDELSESDTDAVNRSIFEAIQQGGEVDPFVVAYMTRKEIGFMVRNNPERVADFLWSYHHE